jgi:uncharacterized repeat protein (TIGR03833 family)
MVSICNMDRKQKSGGKYIKSQVSLPKKTFSHHQKQIPLPKKGDKVEIIIKPYKSKITKIGIIKDVLTKKKYHSRGHKVRLEDGTIGRIVKKLK